jgi:hypothetical protein
MGYKYPSEPVLSREYFSANVGKDNRIGFSGVHGTCSASVPAVLAGWSTRALAAGKEQPP